MKRTRIHLVVIGLHLMSPAIARAQASPTGVPPADTSAVEAAAGATLPGKEQEAPVIAQELTPLPLEKAVKKALSQNPQIIAGELSIEAAVSARKSARANFLPLLTSDLRFIYYSEKPGFGDFAMPEGLDPAACGLFGLDEGDEQAFCNGLLAGFSEFGDMSSSFESEQYDFNVTITVAQPLTPLYQAYHGYKLADLGVDVSSIELEKTKADLKMQTIEAYYGYLKAKAAKKAIEEAIVGVEAHVKKAEAFFAADFMTKNDLLQAQVRLAQLRGTQLEIEQGVTLAREGLLILLNEPPGTPLEPADEPGPEKAFLGSDSIPNEEEAFELAQKHRPELKQMLKVIEQADSAVKLTAGGFIPTVSVFASYQHQEGSVMEMPDFLVGASLNWNIFQWGKVYYAVDEAKARRAAAEAGFEALERALKLEVQQALLLIELSRKKIEINQEAVTAAQEQLRIENERYDKQVSTTTEVLDATTRLVQAQVDLATSQYDHLLAIAKLKKACGTL